VRDGRAVRIFLSISAAGSRPRFSKENLGVVVT
jgi:hypothetical protein